ncbi:hypothetical protein B0T10DRAFT_466911 [Thelonectria olida]|uniref:C2H2-type domain-containing protein n=1 Tax=Thelonectria olida TaxID=1576542 RepID=A0A9P9AI66_9HYPO|nr:hypothetical protein B0T10DRAFT_466911 [Thelonectria olida]
MAKMPRTHRCHCCSRDFARLEHLQRHERPHTKEKPSDAPAAPKLSLETHQGRQAQLESIPPPRLEPEIQVDPEREHEGESEVGPGEGALSPQSTLYPPPTVHSVELNATRVHPDQATATDLEMTNAIPRDSMAFNMNVFDFAMGTVLDDFASFMRQVPIPGDMLSPTFQALPPFFPEISLPSPVSTAERTSASDWSSDLGTQGTACSNLPSVLSPYGSRQRRYSRKTSLQQSCIAAEAQRIILPSPLGAGITWLASSRVSRAVYRVISSYHRNTRCRASSVHISMFSITIIHSSISPHFKWTI